MGTRMRIYEYGKDDFVGDDHKFYGYADWDDVKLSFIFLALACDKRHSDFFDEYSDFIDDHEVGKFDGFKDMYNIFCCLGSVGPVQLTYDKFKTFAEFYIMDLRDAHPDWDISDIEAYMKKLKESKCSKILEWA